MYDLPDEDVVALSVQHSNLAIGPVTDEELNNVHKIVPAGGPAQNTSGSTKKQSKGGKMMSNIGEDEDEEASGEDLSEEEEAKDENDVLKALNMDAYDDDEEDEDEEAARARRFLGGSSLTMYADPRQDPNIDPNEDDEDFEEQVVSSTDSCILVGHTNEDDSSIEVYLFDEKTSNLYVHHEFIIPAFPLCIQWVGTHPKPYKNADDELVTTGSFAAVGTFLPGIELWNCDVMNPIEPTVILGGYETAAASTSTSSTDAGDEESKSEYVGMTKNKKKKEKKKAKKRASQKKLKADSHTDAVMCLAWNIGAPEYLASGSADKTIKLWDITKQACVATFTQHKDKVQSLEWNPEEEHVLLSGGFDRRAIVQDIRTPETAASVSLSADVEMVRWSPHDPLHFAVTTEDGRVSLYDCRNMGKPVWSIQAHKKAASNISFNLAIPSLFATSSVDKTIKVWDCAGGSILGEPDCLVTRDLGVGSLYTMSFDRSSPFIIAAGGDAGCLAIWDSMENVTINERYGKAAEKLGLGPQDLSKEHIELQKQGKQAKGLGPGPEISKKMVKGTGFTRDADEEDEDDSDMDDSSDNRMQYWGGAGPQGARGGNMDGDDDEEAEEEEDD